MDTITFEDFKKIEIRIGKILSCEKVEGTDKLLKSEVDFGKEIGKRQIISAIANSYAPEELVGKKFPFVVNLETRKIRGFESQGMILAIDTPDKTILLEPTENVGEGAEVA
jgi:methionine--tRNA ligase beta chain